MSRERENDDKRLSRRVFLHRAAVAGLAAGGMGLLGACGGKKAADDTQQGGGTPAISRRREGGMTYRTNPTTGDKVSVLGYGCMRFPTRTDENNEEVLDQEQINRLIDHALENGVNYFDTSPAYCKGQSEQALGKALSRHPRESYFIATKLSNFSPQTWGRKESMEMFANSLRYLQTDYVDYLLLHAIGMGGMEEYRSRYEDNGILDYLIGLRRKGTIRNLGFSYHGDVEVFDHMLKLHDEGRLKWDFAQIQLNYLDWRHAKEINERNTDAEYLYGELHRRGIPAVIMEPLLGGRLASTTRPITAKMKSRRPDESVASWAFRYAGSPEGVLTVLSGMTYMGHLKDNLATYSPLDPVTEEEKEFLDGVAREMIAHPLIGCTNCKYCMPCPYGVDIPGLFAHYNRCVSSDLVAIDNSHPDYARMRRAYLTELEREVPRARQADHCIGCGECLKHCPQHIGIPGEMGKLSKYAEYLRTHVRESV